jgi:Ferritin-like domain
LTPPSGGEQSEEPSGSRRTLLSAAAAGCGALLLSGCGKSNPLHVRIRKAGPVPPADVPLLNALLDLEHMAVWAYAAGIPLLSKDQADAAKVFLNQELSHKTELAGLIRQADATPNQPLAAYDVGHPRTSDDVLRVFHRIESEQLTAYLRTIPRLQHGPVRAAALALFANDAQHVAVLRFQLGLQAVPAALVTGRE